MIYLLRLPPIVSATWPIVAESPEQDGTIRSSRCWCRPVGRGARAVLSDGAGKKERGQAALGLDRSLIVGVGAHIGNQSIDVPSNDLITSAGSCLELGTFEKLYFAAIGPNQARSLKLRCDLRNGRSSRSEHVGEKFVGEWNSVAVYPVARLQKPATQAGSNIVQGVTCRRLLDLAQLELHVSDDEIPNARILRRGGSKRRR